jgi:opacity protein-like surface antigen
MQRTTATRALLFVALFSIGVASAATANVSEPPFEGEGARDDPDFSRPAAYLGVGGTFAVEDFDTQGEHSDSGSILFRAGYRGASFFAVEFLGEVLPEFDGKGSPARDVSAFAVTVSGKLLAPLGRAEPYVAAGIGILDVDVDGRSRRDDFAFRGAAGIDIHLTRNWTLYGEAAYLLPAGDVDDFAYATLGGGFLFRF